uniref:Outer membrane protein n=1 Tax=Globodera pallida TaxID=36090 RepID=A0A183CGX6_GLOPA
MKRPFVLPRKTKCLWKFFVVKSFFVMISPLIDLANLNFQIGFNPKYAKINGTEAQILGDKEQYKYIVYKKYFKKDSAEPETSSSENQLVNKFATLLGKKKTKPTHF